MTKKELCNSDPILRKKICTNTLSSHKLSYETGCYTGSAPDLRTCSAHTIYKGNEYLSPSGMLPSTINRLTDESISQNIHVISSQYITVILEHH